MRLPKTIKGDWTEFLNDLNSIDVSKGALQVPFDSFLKVLAKYKVFLTDPDKESIHESFLVRGDGLSSKISVEKLFDLNNVKKINTMYKTLELKGQDPILIEQLKSDQVIRIVSKNKKIFSLFSDIKQIDSTGRGYLTINELGTIFKSYYGNELRGKCLFNFFGTFCLSSNEGLIDYKKLRDFLLKEMHKNGMEQYDQ
jgi:Ca2+-binding EF-hand superfamily protein